MTNTDCNGTNSSSTELASFYRMAGIAAVLQVASLLIYIASMATLGLPLRTGTEFLHVYQQDGAAIMMWRSDFQLIPFLTLYLFTFPALYLALRRTLPLFSIMPVLFTILSILCVWFSESSLAMLALGSQYASAVKDGDPVMQSQIIAASQAIIASDMWHGTPGFISGIAMQGSGMWISLLMMHQKTNDRNGGAARGTSPPCFSNWTIYSGFIGNGLDLLQHILKLFHPDIASYIENSMGIFYLVWFPAMAMDFFSLFHYHAEHYQLEKKQE